MMAMILAAGRGERMRPLTDTCPKPLLQAGGQSLIEHHVRHLAVAGFTDIVINYAWLGEQFPARLGDGQRYGVKFQYSNEGATALETAGGIIKALPLLHGDFFLVVNGDIWTDYDFTNLPTQLSGLAHLVLVDNPLHHPRGDFTLTADGRVIDQPALTFSGIGVYARELFTPFAAQVKPLAPLLRQAMQVGRVTGEHFTGNWWDIGTPERLRQLDTFLSESKRSN
jgi:MurNAc alpha-1-phosphate uridylyltransferase